MTAMLARTSADAPAPGTSMGHLYFNSTDAFQTAFAPHAQSILADIPNYKTPNPPFRSVKLGCSMGLSEPRHAPGFFFYSVHIGAGGKKQESHWAWQPQRLVLPDAG